MIETCPAARGSLEASYSLGRKIKSTFSMYEPSKLSTSDPPLQILAGSSTNGAWQPSDLLIKLQAQFRIVVSCEESSIWSIKKFLSIWSPTKIDHILRRSAKGSPWRAGAQVAVWRSSVWVAPIVQRCRSGINSVDFKWFRGQGGQGNHLKYWSYTCYFMLYSVVSTMKYAIDF